MPDYFGYYCPENRRTDLPPSSPRNVDTSPMLLSFRHSGCMMAHPNHVRLTKRSHFDHGAHSVLVRPGSDPGITVMRASSASERVWAAERLTTNKSSRRDHHQATPQKRDALNSISPCEESIPEIAPRHETIIIEVSIRSLKNRRTQWHPHRQVNVSRLVHQRRILRVATM